MNTDASPFLQTLNVRQREAASAREGPTLVAAGPGTGKTRTLTVRLARLIAECGVAPETLLAVTFTTRAARAMRERLERLVGAAARKVCLGTFHGVCLRLLRAEGHRLGLPRDFGVADRSDQLAAMRRALRDVGRPDTRTAAERIVRDMSAFRNRHADGGATADHGLTDVFDAYGRRLRQCGLLDFDDLLSHAVRLLERVPDVRSAVRRQFVSVAVDEYQDVNPAQHRLLRLLVGDGETLWAVGDGDQAIYGFRGAESEHVLQFERRYPKANVVTLERSYRCTPEIAAAASQVIARNAGRPAFTLTTERASGPPVQVVSLPDERAEAAWIVGRIEESVGGTSHYQHYKGRVTDTVEPRARSFRDFAVLCRLHALTTHLQDALTESGIPYRVVGESRFYDKPVVRDALACLRVVWNPHDDGSLARILNCPPRGIGERTQAALEAEAARRGISLFDAVKTSAALSSSQAGAAGAFVACIEQMRSIVDDAPLSTLLARVIDETGVRSWRVRQDARHERDVLLLLAIAATHDETPATTAIRTFLEDAALAGDDDDCVASADAVSLLTIHAAKGLEFPEVILCGVEEGSLPCETGALDEERRLLYVALTRAADCAHLLHCRSRFLFGVRRARAASRFLSEFDDSVKATTVVADRPRRPRREPEPEQLSLLQASPRRRG